MPDLTQSHDLIVLDGSTFFASDHRGDVDPGEALGYFHEDVRHLSCWQLRVDGDAPLGITASTVDYYSARIVLAPSAEDAAWSLRRDRFVTEGVHEDLVLANLCPEELRLTLELRFGADFADVLEAQEGGRAVGAGRRSVQLDAHRVTLWYEQDGFRRGTRIEVSDGWRLGAGAATTRVTLPPRGEWSACLDVVALAPDGEARPLLRCGAFHRPAPEMPFTLEEWLGHAPRLETGEVDLRETYDRSLNDLAALRIRPRRGLRHAMPAGGIPWFMCVFGRDSLLAAYEALPFQPTLAEAALQELAGLQAREWDDRRDAEPGKMPHELRRGKLVALGKDPRDPYYGTHDATQLWLVLLDEYERWTGDRGLVERLEPTARRALAWLDEYADRDGDGYAEYRSRSPDGLRNHCWKDSDDSIAFHDGRIAEPPVATCEIQGYTYDARLRAARLAREVWGDEELAARQEREAAALRERFNRDYWNEERGTYLLALAGPRARERVDSATSNPGQLLWSGIADPGHAARVAQSLLSPELFSGWGVRSMSSDDDGYSPLRYHNGTVWPHDTALVAAGLRRYGHDREAERLLRALLDAAAAFGHRLPEVFAGFARDGTNVPVRYPAALVPQAWAAAAPLLALRTLLGLDVVDGELRVDPLDGVDLRLRGLAFRGERLDVP